MTRGKYADRSAATSARGAAEREAADLRREVEQLHNRLRTEQAAHEAHVNTITHTASELRRQVEAGESDTISELRSEIANLRRDEDEVRRAVGREVSHMIGDSRFLAEEHVALCTIFRLSVAEWTAAVAPRPSRGARRMSNQRALGVLNDRGGRG